MCGYVSGTSDLRGGTGKGPGNIDLKKVPQTLHKWYGMLVKCYSNTGLVNSLVLENCTCNDVSSLKRANRVPENGIVFLERKFPKLYKNDIAFLVVQWMSNESSGRERT